MHRVEEVFLAGINVAFGGYDNNQAVLDALAKKVRGVCDSRGISGDYVVYEWKHGEVDRLSYQEWVIGIVVSRGTNHDWRKRLAHKFHQDLYKGGPETAYYVKHLPALYTPTQKFARHMKRTPYRRRYHQGRRHVYFSRKC